MKTRIYTLLAALLLTVASVQAQTATTISVDVASTILVGDEVRVGVTLDAEINAIATLTVTNSDNSYNKSFYVALEGGEGRYYVPNLAAGTYSITASFAGNAQYAASTSETKTVQVNNIITALALSFDNNDIVSTKTIYVGDFTSFKVRLLKDENKEVLHINAVTTVRLTDKDTFDEATDKVYVVGLVNGKESYEEEEDGNLSPKDYQNALTDFPAGTYKLKATFAGNDVYTGCESNVVTLTVSKIATTLTVADITAITTGQDAVITLTATPTEQNVAAVNTIATVTVGGTDYKVAIVNGTGTCYVPNLTAGTYDVTAQIAEDDKFLQSTSGDAKTLTVNAGSPIVESNAVATVTMTPAINTVVQVKVGNTTYYVPVENGLATFTLPQQVAGTHNVQAQFIEDGQYAASISATQQLVSVKGVTFPFATSQEWATWCDDWAWKKPEGVTAYTISAVSGNTVTITAVEGETIPSHTPLLLRKTGDAVTPTKVITGTGTDNLVSATPTGATLWGNATDAAITEGGFTADGLTAYSLYNGLFYRYEGPQSIAANRCLLTLTPVYSAPVLNIEIGETTNLVSIDNGQLTIDNDVWYTLDGRKLNGKPTKKGLYIHNGRKVVIK